MYSLCYYCIDVKYLYLDVPVVKCLHTEMDVFEHADTMLFCVIGNKNQDIEQVFWKKDGATLQESDRIQSYTIQGKIVVHV